MNAGIALVKFGKIVEAISYLAQVIEMPLPRPKDLKNAKQTLSSILRHLAQDQLDQNKLG